VAFCDEHRRCGIRRGRLSPPFLLLLLLRGYVTQSLSDLDPLPRMDVKLERLGRFEHEHDRAPEAEPAHLLARRERLAPQQGGCIRVDGFRIRPRRRWPASNADVRAEVLRALGKCDER
jgi:hypothetical protein